MLWYIFSRVETSTFSYKNTHFTTNWETFIWNYSSVVIKYGKIAVIRGITSWVQKRWSFWRYYLFVVELVDLNKYISTQLLEQSHPWPTSVRSDWEPSPEKKISLDPNYHTQKMCRRWWWICIDWTSTVRWESTSRIHLLFWRRALRVRMRIGR